MRHKNAWKWALLALVLFALAGYRIMPMVKVTNLSNQDIEILQIEVSGKRLDSGALANGKTVRHSLRITRDSRFMVNFQFADGRTSRTPVGHIFAPAWWSRTHITIHPDGSLDISSD